MTREHVATIRQAEDALRGKIAEAGHACPEQRIVMEYPGAPTGFFKAGGKLIEWKAEYLNPGAPTR